MLNNKRVLAIIPARAGSKRLPQKNILKLGGVPLIAWTIGAAKKSRYIDDIFISTDDENIVNIAENFGLDVPELRPDYLSSDNATTESVVLYTLKKFGKEADIVLLLQPTSPFRNSCHIDEALELFEEKEAFSVISVTPCEHPPEWSNYLPENNSMENFIRPKSLKRSQELPVSFRLNGAIYIFDAVRLLNVGGINYDKKSFAYKMSNKDSIDIDNQFDFDMAEFFMEKIC